MYPTMMPSTMAMRMYPAIGIFFFIRRSYVASTIVARTPRDRVVSNRRGFPENMGAGLTTLRLP